MDIGKSEGEAFFLKWEVENILNKEYINSTAPEKTNKGNK